MVTSTAEPFRIHDLFLIEICEGDYGRALSRLSPMSLPALETHFWVRTRAQLAAQAYALQGEAALARAYYDSARVYLEARIQEQPKDERLYASLGIALAGLGLDKEAVQAAQRAADLMPLSKDTFRGPEGLQTLARVYTMVGDYGAAVAQLDRLLSIPSEISVPLLRIDPAWDPLRDDPRFQALLDKYSLSSNSRD